MNAPRFTTLLTAGVLCLCLGPASFAAKAKAKSSSKSSKSSAKASAKASPTPAAKPSPAPNQDWQVIKVGPRDY
ncbi:MAG: hypothetical protein ACJ8M4_06960, partial [Chthoniobacterales bacterium]